MLVAMPDVEWWAGEIVDRRRWIRTAGCAELDFLLGNSYTFPGRMYAYCPHQAQGYSVSLDEMEEMSPEAKSWVDGFLAGNAPNGEYMFGDEFHDLDDDDPRVEQWREAVASFRRTGQWPVNRVPD